MKKLSEKEMRVVDGGRWKCKQCNAKDVYKRQAFMLLSIFKPKSVIGEPSFLPEWLFTIFITEWSKLEKL